MSPALHLACALFVLPLIGLTGMYCSARVCGFVPSEAAIGLGPKAFGFKLFGHAWVVRWIPFGGSLKFPGDLPDDVVPPGVRPARDANLLEILILQLGGCVMLFGFAALVLGPIEATRSAGRGFYQFPLGALSPWKRALPWLQSLFGPGWRGVTVWAYAASKVLAMNLVPSPGTNGWFVMRALFIPKREPSQRLTCILGIAVLLVALGCLMWVVVFARFAWQGVAGR